MSHNVFLFLFSLVLFSLFLFSLLFRSENRSKMCPARVQSQCHICVNLYEFMPTNSLNICTTPDVYQGNVTVRHVQDMNMHPIGGMSMLHRHSLILFRIINYQFLGCWLRGISWLLLNVIKLSNCIHV